MSLLQPGARVDRFVVESLLGRGGLAEVYKVRHEKLGSTYALKVVTVPGKSVARRLLQEGRIQSQLKHPAIVAVTDVIEFDAYVALVLEYVEGASMRALIDAHGRLPLDDAAAIFAHVLAGVGAAHTSRVLHRDLKPENILLAPVAGGIVAKVTDFGIAKMLADEPGKGETAQGVVMGTPGYMAPEQCDDASQVDARADIFSLGVTLYEMLTGVSPFERENLGRTIGATLSGQYTPIRQLREDAPDAVVDVVIRCLQVEADARYPDIASLATALYPGGGDNLAIATGLYPPRPIGIALPADVRVRAAGVSVGPTSGESSHTAIPEENDLPPSERVSALLGSPTGPSVSAQSVAIGGALGRSSVDGSGSASGFSVRPAVPGTAAAGTAAAGTAAAGTAAAGTAAAGTMLGEAPELDSPAGISRSWMLIPAALVFGLVCLVGGGLYIANGGLAARAPEGSEGGSMTPASSPLMRDAPGSEAVPASGEPGLPENAPPAGTDATGAAEQTPEAPSVRPPLSIEAPTVPSPGVSGAAVPNAPATEPLTKEGTPPAGADGEGTEGSPPKITIAEPTAEAPTVDVGPPAGAARDDSTQSADAALSARATVTPPAVIDATGTWKGTWSGRQMTLRIKGSTAELEVVAGANYRTWLLRGMTQPSGQFEYSGGEGSEAWWVSGVVKDGQLTGMAKSGASGKVTSFVARRK